MTPPSEFQVIIPAAGCSRRLERLTRERPKSLLEIDGKPILEHSLDILAARGFTQVTLVVGYKRECLVEAFSHGHAGMEIEYVVNADYASTEHGWTLFLARDSWARARRPVVFMDADNLYDPEILDRLMRFPDENVVVVDGSFAPAEREEELVTGRAGRITGLVRGKAPELPDCVGGFVGINRFSSAYMASLFDFMDEFFAAHGRSFKYERLFDACTRATGAPLAYLDCAGLAWININHEEEYAKARAIAGTMLAWTDAG